MSPTLVFLIVLALVFDFLNGFQDASSIIATVISTRALPPRVALTLTALAEFAGPFIFGVAVAKTIGQDLVLPGSISTEVIVAALLSAILWNLLTWYLGIPSSSSHALVGGILGAVTAGTGPEVIQTTGLTRVLFALFASPLIGMVAGYFLTKLTFFLAQSASPRINWFFRRAQILTAITLALSHGANDAQKTMGIITLGLITTGYLPTFQVPLWVVALSAAGISLGAACGAWRLIRTLGGKFYKIRPVHGFCAQMASTSVILVASLLGGPVSTTQVVSSAIIGAGSAERLNKVRWGVAGNILLAWILTIPATALVAAAFYWLFLQTPSLLAMK